MARTRVIFNLVFLSAALVLGLRAYNSTTNNASVLAPARSRAYRLGDVVRIVGVDSSQSPATLAVYIMPAYTSDRMYGALAALSRRKSQARLLVLARDADGARTALAAKGVLADDVIAIDTASTGITGAPTLLVLNIAGEVKGLWRGVPDEEIQREIEGLLLSLSVNRQANKLGRG